MNKIIKDQLSKVQFADLSNFDEATNRYFIPKKSDIKIEKYKSYLIELSDKCFDKDNIININWNKSRIPNCKFYKAEIVDIAAKVVHISGLGYDNENNKDLDIFWDGYVSLNLITILQTL